MPKSRVLRTTLSALVAVVAITLGAAPISLQKFDTNHSTIAFTVPILGGMSEVEGKFTDFTIDAAFDEQHPEASHVKAVIHATSVSTGIKERDDHLHSSDFFDVAKFPDITFQSTAIEKTADGYIARGDFTMHGVTKAIALPFRITGEKRDAEGKTLIIAFAAQTHLNRQDYGVAWRHPVDPTFVGDDVQIRIHLITKKTALAAG